MQRYRISLEYDGTRYAGWQVQQNAKSVQGALITAARAAFDDVGQVMGSGRTDAGVHALEQVAHIDLPAGLPARTIIHRLNDNLPADVNVRSAAAVDARFHARHDAKGRSYIYQIATRRTAFAKPFVWWIKDEIDVGRMRRAAVTATGMHDYAAFADLDTEEGSTKVLVESLEIAVAGELILVRMRASHFLRKMVRRVVGTLVEIGRGSQPPALFNEALEAGPDLQIRFTAPPSGLFLDQVIYPGESYRPDLRPAIAIRDR
ncbi:MAG TPA: tRNA pseudouridine(38-40) synthase TruA [Candidatus Kapabacteria bacterium]|jgi:tRNA pseudouridine38-40 synthase|nr:tRNA pseudouridine(38-40) synthase TruA [Candidatus Kapabacteria bacterium]